MLKRVFLFLATNMAIMLVVSIVAAIVFPLLGLSSSNGQGGTNYNSLLVMSAIMGFVGSIVSLLMSKSMAKRSVGAQVIDQPSNAQEKWLVETVAAQAQRAGIGMPEVALYNSPEINAFATGAFKNSALVAVSTGLLDAMTKEEAEAVLAHEISHVANGDMVTLTLIQGVVNTFVIFLAHIVGTIVDSALRRDGEQGGRGFAFYITQMIAQVFFGMLASVIVMWFSRLREFRADAGGAGLTSNQHMANALRRIQSATEPAHMPESMTALGISGKRSGLARLMMTHPPLEERIARLEGKAA